LPDGRLVGLVVTAESEKQLGRLYVVPLADVLAAQPALVEALEAVSGRVVVEVRHAPVYRRLLYGSSLDAGGGPVIIQVDTELERFGAGKVGVKPTSIVGEPEYLDYVPRDGDRELRQALADAEQAGRMLLVVGESAAGKSRSTVEAMRAVLAGHRLLHPLPGELRALLELLPSASSQAVVWLDDAHQYADAALADTLRRLSTRAVVVGTIRRAELDRLTTVGEIRDPAGEALTDPSLVEQLPWRFVWSPGERDRVSDHVTDTATRAAVAAGTPLGAWSVAGPQLVDRFERFKHDEAFPCKFRLVETVLGWYRTGIGRPMPRRVLMAQLTAGDCSGDEVSEAFAEATRSVFGEGRNARYSLVSLDGDEASPNDYLLNYDQQTTSALVPEHLWTAALSGCMSDDERWRVGLAAAQQRQFAIALQAFELLRAHGHAAGTYSEGVALSELKHDKEALEAYDRMLEHFAHETAPAVRELVAKAERNRAVTLWRLRRPEGAIEAYDALLQRLEDDPAPVMRERVAKALNDKGFVLSHLGRHTAALAAHEELLDRFHADPYPAIRAEVAKALDRRADMLRLLGHHEE
jgi:tetratricopeptide (TPR) repeat protein